MIEQYREDFEGMKADRDRETIVFFRNSVILILAMIKKDKAVLEDQDFLSDAIRALAVREALKQTNLLYDA